MQGRNFDYAVLIPTYNRPDMLASIVEQIFNEAKRSKLKTLFIIYDDGSKCHDRYQELEFDWKRRRISSLYLRSDVNRGRVYFWKTISSLLGASKRYNFEYAYVLADDCVLCNDFIRRTTHHFRFMQEQDEKIHAFNLMQIHPTNWGTTHWIDGAFMCTQKFLRVLGYRIEEIPERRFGKQGEKPISSGVWQQVTRRVANSSVRIAPVTGVSYVMVRAGNGSRLFPHDQFPGRQPNLKWASTFVDFWPRGSWRADLGWKPEKQKHLDFTTA